MQRAVCCFTGPDPVQEKHDKESQPYDTRINGPNSSCPLIPD